MSDGTERFISEPVREGDDRNHFQRDRDIILYTSALRRLSAITQVVSPYTGHVFHNRLTHTLQVAQVGRRLAEKLLKRQSELAQKHQVDPDVVETACLAHDLGHPPFGHLAEHELQRFARYSGSFEGNAQSFRIVTVSAFRSTDYEGLNLTRRSLRAVLKYPWLYSSRPEDKLEKWGSYDSEASVFKFAINADNSGPVSRSAEAELMDWSDDLTYSVHDVEDFYRAGLIPLHSLRPTGKQSAPNRERDNFLNYVWAKRDKIAVLKDATQLELDETFGNTIFPYFTINGPFEGTQEQRARLRSFSSQLINRYINALRLQDSPNETVKVDEGILREIAILKQLTWRYVIEAPSLALQQRSQSRMIKTLCRTFLNEARRRPSNLLPPYYREQLQKAPGNEMRIVVDMVASMTEVQVIDIYQRLFGITIGSGLEKLSI